jgi:hypothetical protein
MGSHCAPTLGSNDPHRNENQKFEKHRVFIISSFSPFLWGSNGFQQKNDEKPRFHHSGLVLAYSPKRMLKLMKLMKIRGFSSFRPKMRPKAPKLHFKPLWNQKFEKHRVFIIFSL